MDRRVVVAVVGLTTLSQSHHITHMESIGVTGWYIYALRHIGLHPPLPQGASVERCIVLVRNFFLHSPSFLPICPHFISLLHIPNPPLQHDPIPYPHSLLSLPSPSTQLSNFAHYTISHQLFFEERGSSFLRQVWMETGVFPSECWW